MVVGLYIHNFMITLIYYSIFIIFIVLISYILNKVIKSTNWYKNQLQFLDLLPSPYVTDKYDIVNLGSNPARFSFFYENINGANFSAGTQDLYMDLCILKHYKNRIKKGTYILIPLSPFSSITAYLTPQKLGLNYYKKFYNIEWCRNSEERNIKRKAIKRLKYPLIYSFKESIKALIIDSKCNNQIEITEMFMMYPELVADANQWIKIWKKEFDIEDLNTPLNEPLIEARKKSISMLSSIIDYCIEQEYKPIIVLPPLQKELSKLFTYEIKEIYVDSFIREISDYNIPLLDYMKDESFSDSNLFINTLFMNLKGRKLFTNEILKKIKEFRLH